MVSDAFFCVENFPARNTKIDVAHCASHDIGPSTSRFGILLPPFHICSRIELLVCPSVQLANIIMRFSSWNHRHVVPAGVETHLHPTPCRRESLISIFGALFLESEEGTNGASVGSPSRWMMLPCRCRVSAASTVAASSGRAADLVQGRR